MVAAQNRVEVVGGRYKLGQGEMGLESVEIGAVPGLGRQRTAHRASSVASGQKRLACGVKTTAAAVVGDEWRGRRGVLALFYR
ncbi:hypothetical protein E2562_025110 [Oryza meyeriana var. granulata]|uniref:Uncharacterized protein n=1 Tax=Oryza meyeriana var. granulata TaxID=110450 RepID=A0A6G1CGV5_9ORYZ|nr:hypothetical protein E2562_025110 [Oryza meyeriana var. granulata]